MLNVGNFSLGEYKVASNVATVSLYGIKPNRFLFAIISPFNILLLFKSNLPRHIIVFSQRSKKTYAQVI